MLMARVYVVDGFDGPEGACGWSWQPQCRELCSIIMCV